MDTYLQYRSREVSASRRFQIYYFYRSSNRGYGVCPLYRVVRLSESPLLEVSLYNITLTLFHVVINASCVNNPSKACYTNDLHAHYSITTESTAYACVRLYTLYLTMPGPIHTLSYYFVHILYTLYKQ